MVKFLRSLRWKKLIIGLLLLYVAYFVLATLLPYLSQKKVGASFAASVQSGDYYSDTVGTDRVACIEDNLDALLWRIRLIEQAQDELIYVSFDFLDDTSGTDVIAALLSAADRGVKVKVMIDGFSSTWTMVGSKAFQALSSHKNVQMKIYNPFTLVQPWRNQARMHDKYLIADDQAYLLGGRNTSDLFLGEYSEKRNYDREVLVYDTAPSEDNSLSQLKTYFQSVWDLPASKVYSYEHKAQKLSDTRQSLSQRYEALKGLYPEAFTQPDWLAATVPTNRVRLLSNPFHPGNKEPQLWYTLTQLMQTGESVLIQTPYVICNKEMYGDLEQLIAQGKDISILTNSPESGANVFGTGDFRLEKKKIVNRGIHVFEFTGDRSSHTKSIFIGDRLSIIGSYNMDMRSTYLDTELMVVVDSLEFSEQMQQHYEMALSQSRQLQPDGTYLFGENYEGKTTNPIVAVLSTFLGVISRPFRFLL